MNKYIGRIFGDGGRKFAPGQRCRDDDGVIKRESSVKYDNTTDSENRIINTITFMHAPHKTCDYISTTHTIHTHTPRSLSDMMIIRVEVQYCTALHSLCPFETITIPLAPLSLLCVHPMHHPSPPMHHSRSFYFSCRAPSRLRLRLPSKSNGTSISYSSEPYLSTRCHVCLHGTVRTLERPLITSSSHLLYGSSTQHQTAR